MIFSDESTFEVQLAQPRLIRKGPEPYSSRHTVQRVKQPQKVMVWGCMSSHGMGRIHIVEGTMKSQQYIEVLQTRLLPQAREWFGEDYVFQQDNTPCHTSRMLKNFFQEEGILVLPWPSNSPDMNPIETIWAVIKRQLEEHTLTSRAELIRHILDITQRDTPIKRELDNTCRKLVASMPKRVNELYHAKGSHTKY